MLRIFAVISTVATLAACSTGSITSGFGVMDGLSNGASFYDVPVVRAAAPAEVQIFNQKDTLLGTAQVDAGTHTDVRVNFDTGSGGSQDLIAKLVINGAVVDEADIAVTRSLFN